VNTARLLILILVTVICLEIVQGRPTQSSPTKTPQRIISLVPAVTEMLVAIGAGRKLVGIGSFGKLPPSLDNVPRVGGLLDPNTERILKLRADLVILYATQTDLREQLVHATVPVFDYSHTGLSDITDTLRAIGQRTGHLQESKLLARKIDSELESVHNRVRGRNRPRTLLVFDRQPLSLRSMYASGGVGFLHDMLVVAGGNNVLGNIERQAVQLTTELILSTAPEVIIELRYGRDQIEADQLKHELNSWHPLASLEAVKSGRLYLLESADIVIPGPQTAIGTEKLARVLHPDAFQQTVEKSISVKYGF